MNGLRSCHQNRGSRQAPSPGPMRLPSKKLADSIRSGSVSTARSCLAAMGAAVSWARCSGEAMTATMSRSGQRVGDGLRLRPALVGQVKSGQPAVEDAAGVVHLAVPHHMDAGLLGHQAFPSGVALAAARGREGSASAMRPNAVSSSAAETNHASNALHGGYTPASSRA